MKIFCHKMRNTRNLNQMFRKLVHHSATICQSFRDLFHFQKLFNYLQKYLRKNHAIFLFSFCLFLIILPFDFLSCFIFPTTWCLPTAVHLGTVAMSTPYTLGKGVESMYQRFTKTAASLIRHN